MKKNWPFILLIISFCLVLDYHFECFAQEFGYLNIKWEDDLNTVKRKIKENRAGVSEIISGPDGKGFKHPLNKIMDFYQTDMEKYEYLASNSHYQTNDEEKQIGYSPTVTRLTMYGNNEGLVDEAQFHFSNTTGKLLSYTIYLSDGCTDNEYDNRLERYRSKKATKNGDYSIIYNSIVEKYDKSSKISGSYSEKWEGKNQTLYYTCLSDQIFLIYFSEKNLRDHVSTYNAAKKKYEEKVAGKLKDVVNKNF